MYKTQLYRKIYSSLKTIILIFLLFSFFSCKNSKVQTVFLSDRHGLSYQVIEDYCKKNGPTALVLFDYHNDVNLKGQEVTSYDWLGLAILNGYVNKVYWVPEKSLNEVTRSLKKEWLINNTENKNFKDDSLRNKITDTFEICDFNELKRILLPDDFLISLDFDIFTINKVEQEQLFDEVVDWMKKQKTKLITLSFSAAYNPDPVTAWNFLYDFINEYDKKAVWYFKSGEFNEKNESLEDLDAWNNWKNHPEIFNKYGYSFFRGAHLWINCPVKIQDALIEKKVLVWNQNDATTQTVVECWKDENHKKLCEEFSEQKMEYLKQIAVDAIEKSLDGAVFMAPESSDNLENNKDIGVAVRLRTTQNDRGCLALYCGVKDLEQAVKYCAYEATKDPRYSKMSKNEIDDLFINISIFSNWNKIDDCKDFIPGFNSLIVDNPNAISPDLSRTLLQSTIASEYNYDVTDFLQRICRKAKLSEDDWKKNCLVFYKSDTIFLTAKTK